MNKHLIGWLLSCLLGYAHLCLAAPPTIKMTVNPPQLAAGEHLTLSLELKNFTAEQPALNLPQSWLTHFNLNNADYWLESLGANLYVHRWELTLQHKQVASISRTLNLEPLTLAGQTSAPLQIRLLNKLPSKPTNQTKQNLNPSQPLLIEHHLNMPQAYIGQTLIYELSIRYQGYPHQPRLSPLKLSGATARKLDDGQEQGFRQQGINWHEAKWQEVIQIYTDPVIIEPRYFTTHLNLGTSQQHQEFSAQTQPIHLKPKPIPASWPSNLTWLPALGVTLDAKIINPPANLTLDTPLELEIYIHAVGQQARNLPRFDKLASSNWNLEPISTWQQDKLTAQFLVGSLKQTLLLYPKHTGVLDLPSLNLSWWDIQAEQLTTEQVQLGSFTVKNAADALEPPELNNKQLITTNLHTPKLHIWLGWLLIVFLLLLSLSLAAWLIYSAKPQPALAALNP